MLLVRFIICFLLCSVIMQCGDPVEEADGFLPIEVEQLMASGTFKVWVRTELVVNGEKNELPCEDSLVYQFSRPIKDVTSQNALLMAYNPFKCDSVGFCQRYPNICEEMINICEMDSTFCSNLAGNAVLAGTWQAVRKGGESMATDQVQINYPNDTTIVTITNISSGSMEFTYTNFKDSEEQQVTEKFITIEQ